MVSKLSPQKCLLHYGILRNWPQGLKTARKVTPEAKIRKPVPGPALPDPVNRLSAQKGASLIPASVSEPSGHYTYCIWSSPSLFISGAIDCLYTKALLAVMDASQALFLIGNPVVLCSEKLPFIFLHGTLLSVFMGRRNLAFGSVPPPVGGFWMCSGITIRTQADEDETPPSAFLNYNHKSTKKPGAEV